MTETEAARLEDELRAVRKQLDEVTALASGQRRALVDLGHLTRALAVLNAALLEQLGDSASRKIIRTVALAQLQGPTDAPAAALVRQFTDEVDPFAAANLPPGALSH